MIKFKSIPNQGTKVMGLPIVGDVEFSQGEVEIEDSKVEELLKLDFGFKLIFLETKKASKEKIEDNLEEGEGEDEGEEDEGEEDPLTKETLMGMTTQAMKDFMKDAFGLTADQVADITKGKKKEEVADEILERINAISTTD